MQNQKDEEIGIGEGINEFIQKYRKPILVALGAVVVLLVISIIALSLMDVFRKRAIAALEDLSSRYESLSSSLNEEDSSGDVARLLADLESFAQGNSGYAGGKAWDIIGSIHSERNEWAEAEAALVKAAETAAKTYLGPVSWFNAAVAAEQQGRAEQAIDYYGRCVSAPSGFPSAARAQFSIGRLHEALGETDEAIAAYRAVLSDWPNDGVWTDLARSKIIMLELNRP